MQSDIYYFCNHEHNYYVVIFITTSLNSSAMLNVFEILSNKECNFREFSIMSEPMDLEEEMLRPPSPGTKEYEAAFPALYVGPDSKVSEVDLNFSLLDENDEDRIVSHDGKMSNLGRGDLTFISKNEISPLVKNHP